ncbi:MAG: iron-sulfur cluster assembly scaffold protein [Gammaproteobacteria bacterium]|nr:iron-sulfur cluster assembly scaffold protein [Gammaproteobacteria bacterium]MDH3480768.1 iron-sulfur cluster assembly scaffold protein [Gammaproteobacteria bacterium]
MSNDAYSARVRDYFARPAHAGDLSGGVAVDIDEQGVRIRLAALGDRGRIQSLRFRAWGCPHVIAACEYFCARYEGAPIESLDVFQASDIMNDLSVPVEKTGRILVIQDAVRSLGRIIGGGSAA